MVVTSTSRDTRLFILRTILSFSIISCNDGWLNICSYFKWNEKQKCINNIECYSILKHRFKDTLKYLKSIWLIYSLVFNANLIAKPWRAQHNLYERVMYMKTPNEKKMKMQYTFKIMSGDGIKYIFFYLFSNHNLVCQTEILWMYLEQSNKILLKRL